jgi:hypothetical protein
MNKPVKMLLVLLLLCVLGFSIAYMSSEKGKPFTAKDCVEYCKPRQGVMERKGPVIGPDWRPSHRDVECTCK